MASVFKFIAIFSLTSQPWVALVPIQKPYFNSKNLTQLNQMQFTKCFWILFLKFFVSNLIANFRKFWGDPVWQSQPVHQSNYCQTQSPYSSQQRHNNHLTNRSKPFLHQNHHNLPIIMIYMLNCMLILCLQVTKSWNKSTFRTLW